MSATMLKIPQAKQLKNQYYYRCSYRAAPCGAKKEDYIMALCFNQLDFVNLGAMASQWEDELSVYGEEKQCTVKMRHKNITQFENKYLLRQNELLNKELLLTRYTIQALKDMIKQKDFAINQTKKDLDKSIHRIQLLRGSLKQNRLLSSDDSSNTDSDDELASSPLEFDIKSKLFIRQT